MKMTLPLISPMLAQQALGERFAQARLNRNWSQRALALRSGVSLPTVSRLERGQVVGMDVFLKVASALGLLAQLMEAIQVTPLPLQKIQSLDDLQKQNKTRKRGRSGL